MTPHDFKNKNAGRFDEAALDRALDQFAVAPFDQGAAMARVMERLDEKKTQPQAAASFGGMYRWLGAGGAAVAAIALLWFAPARTQDIDGFLNSAQAVAEEIALQEDVMALWDAPADPEIERFLEEIFTDEDWG